MAISFGGVIFSGNIFGVQTILFAKIIVAVAIANCVYYGYAILGLILDYRLKRNEQKRNHTVPKETELETEREMQQRVLQHEKEISQMVQDHEKDMRKMELEHQREMKKLENMAIIGQCFNDEKSSTVIAQNH